MITPLIDAGKKQISNMDLLMEKFILEKEMPAALILLRIVLLT